MPFDQTMTRRHDPLDLALHRIYATYGDTCSIIRKAKTLDKFGEDPDLDAADGFRPVHNLGTDPALPTTNAIDEIVSSAADTQVVSIEGHTISGTDLTFVTQDVTLTGTTPASLGTPLARVTRMYIKGGGVAAGNIDISEGGVTAHARIAIGDVQTQKAWTAISSQDYYIITEYGAGYLARNANVEVQMRFEYRPLVDTDGTAITSPNWRPLTRDFILTASEGRAQFDRTIDPIIVPRNADVRMVADTNTDNTAITASFGGYLASIVS